MVAPAMSSWLICCGTNPSRNVSTSADVISGARLEEASDVDGCGASLLVSGVSWGTWPITHRPSSKATITNEIVFFTISAPEMYLTWLFLFRVMTPDNRLNSPNLLRSFSKQILSKSLLLTRFSNKSSHHITCIDRLSECPAGVFAPTQSGSRLL